MPDASAATAPAPASAMRLPFVRAFAFGRLFAVLGSQALTTAVQWQLYEKTGKPLQLGLIGLAELTPVLLLFVPAGHLVDRVPRRHVAMLAHGFFALVALAFLTTVSGDAPVWWTYVLLVMVGVVRAFAAPSVGTMLPQLLDPEQFAHVNGWMAATWQFASVAGPLVGGGLIALSGDARLAFLAAAVGQLVFLGCLLVVPLRPAKPVAGAARSGVFAGMAFVKRTPVFLAAITLDLFAVLLGGAVALLPIFAKDILGKGPTGLGALRAAPGIGALLVALATTRLPPWKRPGRALLATVCGFGVATIAFGLSRSFWLSLFCLFLTGAFDSVSVVIRMTLEQMVTPDALRGRVAATKFVFIGLSNELGAFESGATAALFGTVPSVVGGGIGTIVVAALVAWKWPQLGRIGPLSTLRPSSDDEMPADAAVP